MAKEYVYRAMCSDELNDTIKNGSASFYKRFKWFSKHLEFVIERVQNGTFNNSSHVHDRYKHIVLFEADVEKASQVSTHELQFDRRKNPSIKFIKVIK